MRASGHAAVVASAVFACMAAHAPAAEPLRLSPVKEGDAVLLFEASRHPFEAVRNYTASWKEGGDLTPAAALVQKDGERWIEFSFVGSRGMACSTIFFTNTPPPDAGMRYRGIALDIDCDRDDYPHIRVSASFSDRSGLSCEVALERGRGTYAVERGFRREKHPPPWDQIAHVMINIDAGAHSADLVYRLRKIALRQGPPDAADAQAIQTARVPDIFGETVLWPQPKRVEWKKGTFPARATRSLFLDAKASERTRRTAALFADRCAAWTGRRPEIRACDAPPEDGITLRVDGAAGRPQGGALSVEPDRVRITGHDEPGLYYGTVTFFQLVRHAAKRGDPALPVPCVEILDWPDTPNRLIRLEHPHTFRNFPVRENRGIDYLIDWTDRYVAGGKFNTFQVDLSANVRYRRRPEFNGSEKIYSLDDLRRLAAFCRDHFIDLCPAWQVGGHANWWLTIGYHPELREKGWPSQGDVTHPDHEAIVRDCMLDVIEALEPKYLSPKSDEWWHERKEDEAPDALLRGKARAQAYLDWHLRLNAWLKERGITMMLFEDMLSPYHNGKRFDTWRIVDAFPKDAILTLWSGSNPDKEIRYFTERGFRVWPNATGMLDLDAASRARVIGFGKGMYSFGDDRVRLLDEYSTLHSLGNLLRVADQAWNFAAEPPVDLARLVAVQHALAIRPNPRAGARCAPIDLAPALTHAFAAFLRGAKPQDYAARERPVALPAGLRDVGCLPMRLAGGGGNDCIALRKGAAPVALPVRGKFSSLVFLHAALVNDPSDKTVAGVRIRDWMYGWPCGNYLVRYADGTEAALPVRLTDNLKRLDTASATRAGLATRYAWPIEDASGRPLHLFQWEWVNPRPDSAIAEVVAAHDNILDVTLLVFAVSGREVSAQEAGAQ